MVLVRDPGDLLELYEQFRLATAKTKGCCSAGQELLGDRRDAALIDCQRDARPRPSIAYDASSRAKPAVRAHKAAQREQPSQDGRAATVRRPRLHER